jgi:hypothetical protein
MVQKIEKSRRYEAPVAGLRSLTALLVLREKIIKPLLAASMGIPVDVNGHSVGM